MADLYGLDTDGGCLSCGECVPRFCATCNEARCNWFEVGDDGRCKACGGEVQPILGKARRELAALRADLRRAAGEEQER